MTHHKTMYDPRMDNGFDNGIEQAAIMLRMQTELVIGFDEVLRLSEHDVGDKKVLIQPARRVLIGSDLRALLAFHRRRLMDAISRREMRGTWDRAGRPFFIDPTGGMLTMPRYTAVVRRIVPSDLRLIDAPAAPARRLRSFLRWYLQGRTRPLSDAVELARNPTSDSGA